MGVLVLDCPHCAAENTSFKVVGSHSISANELIALASCGRCQYPVSAVLLPIKSSQRPEQYHGDLLDREQGQFFLVGLYPQRKPIDVPQDLPDNVASAFTQAEKARRAELWDAACGMYRRAMEIALKEFAPDVEAWKLEKRIDKLAAENRITPELQSWAHELRLDGNEAVHTEGQATQELADQMHGLCKFLLIYLYTLPQQVAAARARRNGN